MPPAANTPAPIRAPVPTPTESTGSAAQLAFRQAILDTENLRERLQAARAAQAEARRRYWQQVGPVAAATVAARRALFVPLEEALLLNYFSRAEEQQITEFILGNAHALQDRFGEDEGSIIVKYTLQARATAPALPPPPATPSPALPPHEQAAAAARARQLAKAREAAVRADQQQLTTNAKTLYRQLARTHHPDLERDPSKQAAKTAQMQRIVEAYEADDLYTLLQLLAEAGPTEAAADDVLARYTRALRQQQAALAQEIAAATQGPGGLTDASPKKQEAALRQLKRELRAEADYVWYIERRLREPGSLREVLREQAAKGLASI